ncbi:MAG: squalene synthase HpnC [Streptosporangiales bacterium]|nr:squalene synthase HpnC [Streptosporangiales bacterium]
MSGGGTEATTGGAEAAGIAAKVSLAVAAKASAENFPVALKILPARWREHLSAVYGFARLTDDLGDEPLPGLDAVPPGSPGATPEDVYTATRLRLLDELAADVARLYAGETPELDIVAALKPTVEECRIPQGLLDDLIAANRQDQTVTRYQSYDDLVKYCELSANPVGRIVLCIVGAATEDRLRLSDNICTALQLAEHWQDVAEDLGNGRVYLPADDLKAFGVTEDALARPTADDAVRRLMAFETKRAADLLDQGAPLAGTLKGAARLAISGYIAGGRAALKAIVNADYDVLAQTPKPSKAATLTGLVSCYVIGR